MLGLDGGPVHLHTYTLWCFGALVLLCFGALVLWCWFPLCLHARLKVAPPCKLHPLVGKLGITKGNCASSTVKDKACTLTCANGKPRGSMDITCGLGGEWSPLGAYCTCLRLWLGVSGHAVYCRWPMPAVVASRWGLMCVRLWVGRV